MSGKTQKKAGALHSELRIELHTQYAINTWSGISVSDGKPSWDKVVINDNLFLESATFFI